VKSKFISLLFKYILVQDQGVLINNQWFVLTIPKVIPVLTLRLCQKTILTNLFIWVSRERLMQDSDPPLGKEDFFAPGHPGMPRLYLY